MMPGRKRRWIIRWKFKTRKRQKHSRAVNTQDFLDLIIDEERKTVQRKDTGEYLGAVSISPINIFGLRDKDQTKFVDTLEIFTNSKKFKAYQIYSSETGADTNTYIDQLRQEQKKLSIEQEHEKLKFQILEDEKRYIAQQTSDQNLVDKYYYVVFRAETQEELEKQKRDALYLMKSVFTVADVSFSEYLRSIFRYYNPFRSSYEVNEKFFAGEGDLCAVDFISPYRLSFQKRKLFQYVEVDGVYCKLYHVYSYPQYPYFAWLSYLTGFKGVDYSMHVSDVDSSSLIKEYDKQYNHLVANYNRAKKESERERIKGDMESVQLMLQSLSRGTKKAVSFVVTLKLTADSIEHLEELEEMLMQETASMDLLLRQGFFDQEKLFLSTAPCCRNLIREYTKNVVCNVISWGFPFVFESLSDRQLPILIGRSRSMGGAIFYDHLVKSKTRANSNEIIFGVTGSGKTYLIMYMIYMRYARNIKQIIIDVEGKQMNKLTRVLKGEVINCAAGYGGRINPLQIRITIDDDEDGKKRALHDICPLASHIQFLRTLFKMYFDGLDRIMLSELEDAIELLYQKWGFTLQTDAEQISRMKPEEFPIMEDLLAIMNEQLEKVERDNVDKRNRVEIVRNFVKRLATGADSTLFNGVTNVSLDNDTICLNLSGLQNKDNVILRTQYYNILSYILTEVISGRFQKWIQIYEDEFHILMSPDMPEVMDFQRKLVKIIRKYNGGLTTSSQEVADVLHDSVKRYGAAIIGNSNYKFFFKQESESIQYLREHRLISEMDAEYLQYAAIGQCYMDLGANAFQMEVVIPEDIKELFDGFIVNEQRG